MNIKYLNFDRTYLVVETADTDGTIRDSLFEFKTFEDAVGFSKEVLRLHPGTRIRQLAVGDEIKRSKGNGKDKLDY